MARVLRHEESERVVAVCQTVRRRRRIAGAGRGLATGKRGRIQIVPEIEANWANGCPVTHPQSNSVGNVVVVALFGGSLLQAQLRILLLPMQQAVERVAAVDENISGIVKDGKADVVLKKGQRRWGHSELQIVQEQTAPS